MKPATAGASATAPTPGEQGRCFLAKQYPAVQGAPLVPPGWVRVADAAKVLGITPEAVRQKVAKQVPKGRKRKIRGVLWFAPGHIPVLADALREAAGRPARPKPEPPPMSQKDAWLDATKRVILDDADQHRARLAREGVGKVEAERRFVRERGGGDWYDLTFSVGSLYRWRQKLAKGEDLRERRGRGRGNRSDKAGPAAWAFFAAMFLRQRLPASEAFIQTLGKSREQGDDPDWKWTLSYSAAVQRLNRDEPPFFRDFHLHGSDKWRADHLTKIDRGMRNRPAYETVEIDGTPANVLCRYGGRLVRLVVVSVVCPASNVFLGVGVALTESAELIQRVMYRVYKQYGAPKVIIFDQGKAFGSEGFSDRRRRRKQADEDKLIGMCRMLRATPKPCTGRSGWQKPVVEVLNRIIDRHDRQWGKFYVGNRPHNRKREDAEYAKKHPNEAPTVEEYEKSLWEYLQTENEHSRSHLGGKSPAEVFAETRIAKREVPNEHCEQYLRRRPQRAKVGTRGVTIRVAGKPYYFGHTDPEVFRHQGETVIAYIDDDDLSDILVTDADHRPLFRLENDGLVGTDTATLREAGRANRRAAKLRREHHKYIADVELPTPMLAAKYKRLANEARNAPKPDRELPRVTILPPHPDQMKPVRSRRAVQKAVGDGTAGQPRGGLTEIFPGKGAGTDAGQVDRIGLFGEAGKDDRPRADVLRQFGERP